MDEMEVDDDFSNLANGGKSSSSSIIKTPLCNYTEMHVRLYGEMYFPADQLWALFDVPFVETKLDKVLNLTRPRGAPLVREFRDWRFGKLKNNYTCSGPRQFRELFIQSKTGRYDAGAIRRGPLEELSKTKALNKPFVVDFDADEYEELRAKCGCGKEKTKMCDKCVTVIRVAATAVYEILRKVCGYRRIACTYSGGRGMHIRVLDVEACCMDDKARADVANLIVNAPKNAIHSPMLADICRPLFELEKLWNMTLGIVID